MQTALNQTDKSHTDKNATEHVVSIGRRDNGFCDMGGPRRIWAVAAIHAQAAQLMDLHDMLYQRLAPGDRLVYLGNYAGYGAAAAETVGEILTFRRMALARPGMMADDIVYLRGVQEEMWNRLLEISFAPEPRKTLQWMLGNGMEPTLRSYGICPQEGMSAAHEGVMALVKWTGRIREALRRHRGHDVFTAQWRRAAYTAESSPVPLLFVHAGLNPARALREQGDSFWWAGHMFDELALPYAPFSKVVRGYDPGGRGIALNCVKATIDGGCGFGGSLVCAGFDAGGNLFDMIEA